MEDVGIQKRSSVLLVEPDGELCFKDGPNVYKALWDELDDELQKKGFKDVLSFFYHLARDFKDIVTTQMKLINPSDEKVCFKVKTTAPRRYCVRPNNGILGPKSSVDVMLRLQPLDKPDNENTKHKFMVQSLFASNGELSSLEKLWRNATTDRLMYVKLKCAFETRDGTRLSTDDINSITVAGSPHSQLLRKISADSTASSTSVNSRELKLYHTPFDYDAKNGPASEDTLKIRQDVEKLRLENKRLKVPIFPLVLKESERQLRKLTAKTDPGGTESVAELGNRSRETIYPSIVYIIVALVIGLIVGKFIL